MLSKGMCAQGILLDMNSSIASTILIHQFTLGDYKCRAMGDCSGYGFNANDDPEFVIVLDRCFCTKYLPNKTLMGFHSHSTSVMHLGITRTQCLQCTCYNRNEIWLK